MSRSKPLYLLILATVLCSLSTVADDATDRVGSGRTAFAQLGQELPDPNVYRTASGAPGTDYWQQRADYRITARLDAAARRGEASADISYTNNSPDTLRYLWLQLDQNRFRKDSLDQRSRTVSEDQVSYGTLREQQSYADTAYGYEGLLFRTESGEPIKATIVDTMARLDLEQPLSPGEAVTFTVDWKFNVLEEVAVGSRGGYEYFEETDTQLFFLAQWFPRLAAYTDYGGWENKAFLGRGEFTLEFGDYELALTVPDNHIVSATGILTNPEQVMTAVQRERLASAGNDTPVFVVTPEEALAN
ncbi:MAG: aminopeptidase, partial [Luminiphilus sp.]|nr:aminopeptidase [Luminiphilus sp.]